MPSQAGRKDKKEVEAIVLDYLPWGFENDKRPINQREPLILALGTSQFKLLELIAKKDRSVALQDVVYIGDGGRKVVERVKRRISYKELTPSAKGELETAVMKIIHDSEQRFVDFYNAAHYFILTKNTLHLLPGFTTQKVTAIMEARQKKPFESFADIKARVKSVKDPEKYICDRIMLELENPAEKYLLFTQR